MAGVAPWGTVSRAAVLVGLRTTAIDFLASWKHADQQMTRSRPRMGSTMGVTLPSSQVSHRRGTSVMLPAFCALWLHYLKIIPGTERFWLKIQPPPPTQYGVQLLPDVPKHKVWWISQRDSVGRKVSVKHVDSEFKVQASNYAKESIFNRNTWNKPINLSRHETLRAEVSGVYLNSPRRRIGCQHSWGHWNTLATTWVGAGKMVQLWSALLLQGDLSLIPSTHTMWFTAVCDSSSEDLIYCLLLLSESTHTHGIHSTEYTHMWIKDKSKNKKNGLA